MHRILVVSATTVEAAHVPSGTDVVVTGIGKVAAATVTTEALLSRRDGNELMVVNIGTVGALRDGLSGLFLPSTVINHEMNGDAIRAGLRPARGPARRARRRHRAGIGRCVHQRSGRAAATRRARSARRHGGYAVAYACQRLGVPVRLVKHVSDQADASALDWPAVVDASARVLGEWVADHAER
jgi:adenosylhomocysteine nucleosidase